MAKPELEREAIRLRQEQRLGLQDIAEQLGVAKSTCSYWLRNYPLTASEIAERKNWNGLKTHSGKPKKDWGQPSKYYKGGLADRNQKGRIAEYAVAFRLALRGIEFYKSSDSGRFDFVVNVGSLKTIQVKWANVNVKWGLPYATLSRSNGKHGRQKYVSGDFDFLVVYSLYDDTAYVYPASVVIGNAAITVSPEYAEKWEQLNAPVTQR